MATEQELRAAFDEDTAEMVCELGGLLHKALLLAERLERRGVDDFDLGFQPRQLREMRDAAERAYTNPRKRA